MAAEPEPPELARLVDYAERPRAGDWSLRSALVRYAEGQPVRASQVIELVRRVDAALHAQAKVLAERGPELWTALEARRREGPDGALVGLLAAADDLDALADHLAAWAEDPRRDRPDAAVDGAVRQVAQHLDDLGVPREEPGRPPRRRG
jgi:hypothetical protein